MIEAGIKTLVVIGLIYTHLEAYKMGKVQGQRDYFHFFNGGKDTYKYKRQKWHYVKPQTYKGKRYQERKGNK